VTETFVTALVGPPFGVNGFLRLRSLSGETDHLAALDAMVLRRGGVTRRLAVEAVTPGNGGPLVKFAGVDSPEAARELTGAEVLVDRAHAAPLGDGEFYVEDLTGLLVVGPAGEPLGRITGVVDGGGGQLAELRLETGAVRLVPFRDEFLGDPDLGAGRIALRETWILE